MKDLFFIAAKNKYRFSSSTHASLTVEQLITIDLDAVDNIAMGLQQQIEEKGKIKSFLTQKTTANISEMQNKLEICIAIIKYRQEQISKSARRQELLRQRQELAKAIDEAENKALVKGSFKALEAKMAALTAEIEDEDLD